MSKQWPGQVYIPSQAVATIALDLFYPKHYQLVHMMSPEQVLHPVQSGYSGQSVPLYAGQMYSTSVPMAPAMQTSEYDRPPPYAIQCLNRLWSTSDVMI